MNTTYITSALKAQQLPPEGLPEIAVVGRSNCGKSTLINGLLNRRNLVRTGRTPGQTRMVNFFGVDERWIIADLPGFGFAASPREDSKHWEELMNGYFRRECITDALLLVDIRRGLEDEELHLLKNLRGSFVWTVVLTKADKATRAEMAKQKAAVEGVFASRGWPFKGAYVVSALKKEGLQPLREAVFGADFKI